METTHIEWVSKEEAGVLLGSIGRPLSTRRVLELAKEGRIESGRTVDPNNGQTVVRLHAGSIERYLEKKRNPAPVPAPERTLTEVSGNLPENVRKSAGSVRKSAGSVRKCPEVSGSLADLVRVVREGCAIAEPARLWLTLQESVDYSGLPAGVLIEFIGAGRLPALDVGRGRRGGRWRVRKVDLRQLKALPLQAPHQVLSDPQHTKALPELVTGQAALA